MKRILIAIVASALMAGAANAAFTVTVDVDNTLYAPGDVVTIDLTLTADNHTLAFFDSFEYQATWDSAILKVVGSDPGAADYGTSSQTLFPELDGAENPACFNDAETCPTLQQISNGSNTVDGTATAQLLLEVLGGAGTFLSDHLTIGIEAGNNQTADSITIGPNYAVATIVPEPTTAALIGLGLIGLGVAGRRR